jgi:flagellin
MFGTGAVSVAVTDDGATTVSLAARDLTNTSSGVGTISNSSVTSLGDAAVTLNAIISAIENVATMRANNGAEQSRLSFATELITINKVNLEAATSRIMDVDVATESTQLARWNILTQSGTAMLAQANQSAQSALRLISS